jgi:hypothetical protein
MRNQVSFNNPMTLSRIVTHHGREKTLVFQLEYGAWVRAE